MRDFRITGFLLCLIILPGRVLGVATCSDDAAPRLAQLSERWRWEMFWKSGIQSPPYITGKRVSIELFWNNDQMGFCSLELDSCALYSFLKPTLRQMVDSSSQLTQDSLDAATRSFLHKPPLPPVVTRTPGSKAASNTREAPVFGTAGRITMPRIQDHIKQRQWNAAFNVCKTEIVLPPMNAPDAIREKLIPNDLARLKDVLARMGSNIPTQERRSVEFVIPFYAPSDPLVYVLVMTKGKPGSIIFLVHDDDWADWKVGGHFDSQFSQFQLDKLVPLIISAKMSSVAVE